MPEAEWLDDGETLTYLHSCISTKVQRVRVTETPAYLDALLADEALVGGLEPRLGEHHLRTPTITGFPSVTFPGLLDELNRQAFAYRWSSRANMIDKRSEEHTSELQSLMRISYAVFCLKKTTK